MIGLFARAPAADNAIRELTEVFDEHYTQSDGKCPELADCKRLYALVGIHESPQKLRLEAAIRMRDERPGNAKNAGIAFEVA